MDINADSNSSGKPTVLREIPQEKLRIFINTPGNPENINHFSVDSPLVVKPKKDWGTKYNHLPSVVRWRKGKKKDQARQVACAKKREQQQSSVEVEPASHSYDDKDDEELEFFNNCRRIREARQEELSINDYFESEYSTIICEEVPSTDFHNFFEEDEFTIQSVDQLYINDVLKDENSIESDVDYDNQSFSESVPVEDSIVLGDILIAFNEHQANTENHRLANKDKFPFKDVKAISSGSQFDGPVKTKALSYIKRKKINNLPTIQEIEAVQLESEYLSQNERGSFDVERFLSTPVNIKQERSIKYSCSLINSYLKRPQHLKGTVLYCSPGTGSLESVRSYPPLLYQKGIPQKLRKEDFQNSGKIIISDGKFSNSINPDIIYTHGLYSHVANLLLEGVEFNDALEDWKSVEKHFSIKFMAPNITNVIKFLSKRLVTKLLKPP